MTAGDTAYAILVALGVSGLAIDGVVKIMPQPQTSELFEVHSIIAKRNGRTADLWVNRTIHVPVHMAFTVRVMEWTDAGWQQYCTGDGGPYLYKPDVLMRQPVTLMWWSNSGCYSLPPGRARIETTWTPHVRGTEPVSYTVEVTG